MNDTVFPGNASASPQDPDVSAFLAATFPSMRPVDVPQSSDLLPAGNCYWNVERQVAQSGGTICFGWLITMWPGVYVEAMHHAVWCMPDEKLIDVSESYPLCSSSSSLFIPHNEKSVDINKLPHIASIHRNISGLRIVDDHIEIYRKMNSLERRASDIFHRMGYRCETQRAIAYGQQPPSPNLNSASQRDMDELISLTTSIMEAKRTFGNSIRDLNATFGGATQPS